MNSPKTSRIFAAAGASVIGLSGDKIEVQRDFSTKECRDKFPVGADPSFSVIKAYDAAFNIPIVGAAFANRISYVISPEGKILYAYSDSNAEKHIENTLAVVRKWREEHKRWEATFCSRQRSLRSTPAIFLDRHPHHSARRSERHHVPAGAGRSL